MQYFRHLESCNIKNGSFEKSTEATVIRSGNLEKVRSLSYYDANRIPNDTMNSR